MRISSANRYLRISVCSALLGLSALILAGSSMAYWVWTPETKKFVNPKYAVKDSPKEQLDWAMSFYDAKDYKRAAIEFEKLAKHYEFSEYAPRAQYYAGLSYENMGKPYAAFQAYQKGVDNFPHTEHLDDIIEREFKIAKLYAEKPNPKVLGVDIMTSVDRAIEIYRKVVENAPFGPLADEAQFRMGEVMKRASMFEEATLAFQKVIDEYPTSKFADKAQYEVAQCAYKASLQPAYDAGPTDRALRIFEEYAASGKDEKLSEEAKRTMQRLKDKAAEKSMMVAKFYEQQHHPKSAIIYYQDVLDRYPDAICAPVAKTRIEILQVEMARPPAGMFGWFRKAEKGEAAPPAPRKKWTPWSLFGKKGEPAAAAGAPVAAITPPAAMPQAVAPGVAAPAAAKPAPKKKGWDFMEILGLTPDEPKPPAVKPPALEAAVAAAKAGAAAEPEAPPPVAYEEKGVDRASPREDDPNLELDDDDRI